MSRARTISTLIVEDHDDVAQIYRAYISRHERFAVGAIARTGAAAVTAIRRIQPELVLLDVHLPDFSGLDVLRWIRAEHPLPVEVIALTAARDVESVTTARAFGVRHYLAKPITPAALLGRLDQVAGQIDEVAAARAGAVLEQDGIDRIIPPAMPVPSVVRPRNIADGTVSIVRSALTNAGPNGLSVDDLSIVAALSRSSSRRYLEYLVESGLAVSANRYGTTGRPVKLYRSM